MSCWRAVLTVALLPLIGGFASNASAEDDWAITREGRAPRRVVRPASPVLNEGERLFRALLADSSDDLTFEQLRALEVAEHGSLQPLERRLRELQSKQPELVRASRALARVLAAEGRWAEARAQLARAIETERDGAGSLLLRARLARSRAAASEEARAAATEEARADLIAVLTMGPPASVAQRVEALRALAEIALDGGDLAQAREHFAELARVRPGAERKHELARALSQRGRHKEAVIEYRNALARGPRAALVESLLELAQAELAADEPERALATLARAKSLGARREELFALERDARRVAGTLGELASQLESEARAGRAVAWRQAADVWRELGDEERARRCLQASLARKPDDMKGRAELAASLERAGEFAAAEREYRELVRRAPESPAHVSQLAELLHKSGRKDEALALLAQSASRRPRDAALHGALRELYTRWGEQRLAEQALERLAALDPTNEAHAIALGEQALAAGDKAAAIAAFRNVQRGAPDDARAEARLARVLGEHDLLAEAIQHAHRAAELAPGASDAQRLLAGLLERAGRDSEAEAAWQRVLGQKGADADARREARQHLAVLLRRSGRLTQRTSELEQLLRESPGDIDVMRLLAELYARDVDKAAKEVALLTRILALSPGDREALLSLEQAQLRQGDVAGALRTVRTQLESGPGGETEVLRALELARRLPHSEEARWLAARAVALSPLSPEVHRQVGELFALRQDPAASRAAYARAVELDPREFAARYALAEEALKSDRELAADQLREVVVGSNDDELVSSALELLLSIEEEDDRPAALLELARKAPRKIAVRRLWMERAVDPLMPLVRRAAQAPLSDAESAQLRALVNTAAFILLEALAGDDVAQRNRALALLEVVPHEAALERLVAIAEQADLAVQERARALVAVGKLASASATSRLKSLLAREERHLRPYVLWALAESAGRASGRELAIALKSDEASAVVAAIALGRAHVVTATGALAELADRARPSLSAAALWALSRLDAHAAQARLEPAAQAKAPLSTLALSGAVDPARALAAALFAAQPELRADAVRLVMRTAPSPAPLAPSWPFEPLQYVRDVIIAAAPSFALPSRELLAAVALEQLESARDVSSTLDLLVPEGGELVPSAFAEAGLCTPPALRGELGRQLREPLAVLSSRPESAISLRALRLLVLGGAAGHTAVQQALVGTDRTRRDAALDALAELSGASELPSSVREQLALILAQAPEWPTRMRAARALRHTLTSEQLAHEPIALVRAAALDPSGAQRCFSRNSGATN